MRGILFRGMTEDKRWIEGSLADQNGYYISTLPRLGKKNRGVYTFDDFEKVLPETVGQYIGKIDTNKTKIFEGDIVENSDDLYTVEWSEDRARFVLSGDGVEADFDNFWGYELEVIGNIYENKELLEG